MASRESMSSELRPQHLTGVCLQSPDRRAETDLILVSIPFLSMPITLLSHSSSFQDSSIYQDTALASAKNKRHTAHIPSAFDILPSQYFNQAEIISKWAAKLGLSRKSASFGARSSHCPRKGQILSTEPWTGTCVPGECNTPWDLKLDASIRS